MFESLLLIVVVVEAVWILSSIFRGAEDERKGSRPPLGPRPQGGPFPGRQRPPATTVDRFLEEINRRRREAAERQQPSGSPSSAGVSSPKPRPTEARSQPVRRQPRPTPAILTPAPARPSTPRRAPPAEVIIVESRVTNREEEETPRQRTAAKPTLRAMPAPAVENPRTPVPSQAPSTPPFVPVRAQARGPSRKADQLFAMLHNPQTLQAALLLREILGPPLSEQRR